jgi:hypothetical protein
MLLSRSVVQILFSILAVDLVDLEIAASGAQNWRTYVTQRLQRAVMPPLVAVA